MELQHLHLEPASPPHEGGPTCPPKPKRIRGGEGSGQEVFSSSTSLAMHPSGLYGSLQGNLAFIVEGGISLPGKVCGGQYRVGDVGILLSSWLIGKINGD